MRACFYVRQFEHRRKIFIFFHDKKLDSEDAFLFEYKGIRCFDGERRWKEYVPYLYNDTY